MDEHGFDEAQAASARQFDRRFGSYGASHILSDTRDVSTALAGVEVPTDGLALDVATGGGHTALALARAGWRVCLGDVSMRMLESARELLRQDGHVVDARLFPAEAIPHGDATFDLVTVRVAPHHFSSPPTFLREAARVLKSGGRFLLIDGSVPDDEPEVDHWLNRVEKWRDPSHVRVLSPRTWRAMIEEAGMRILSLDTFERRQPDLEWYFEAAGTTEDHRRKVLDAIRSASPRVRQVMRLQTDDGKVSWSWLMLSVLATKTVES
jgi:ubiquinone/menaquinone biosynthesis C-methylase UbiE